MFYGIIIVALAALLVLSVFTSGFGIIKPTVTNVTPSPSPTPSPTPTPTPTPAAIQTLTVTNGNLPVLGSASAPVKIVEFSDYQCPFCGAAEGTHAQLIAQFRTRDPTYQPAMPGVVANYVNTSKVALYFRDYPLSFHQNAMNAAVAARCANAQGKYWQMHDKLFETQAEWSNVADPSSIYAGYAVSLGMNNATFSSCYSAKQFSDQINADEQVGQQYGVQGTPGFFVIIPKNKVAEADLKSVASANGLDLYQNDNEYTVFYPGAIGYSAFDALLNKVRY